MGNKICSICGIEIVGTRRQAHNLKYCDVCRKKLYKEYSRKSYLKRTGRLVEEPKPKKTPQKQAPTKKPMVVWAKMKDQCSFDACPFKSGNKPCLFYFEYKDGTSSCPGRRFVKGSDKNGLAKRSN